MNNSFYGLRKHVRNDGVKAVVAEAMAFRAQLVLKKQYKEASGWDNPFNYWLVDELSRMRRSLGIVSTEQIDATDQGARNDKARADAVNEDQTLAERYVGTNPVNTDDVLMPSTLGACDELPYDFSGADPNIPQLAGKGHKNIALLLFTSALDRFITELTNLDCQGQGTTIPKQQAAMMLTLIDRMYMICQEKGGQSKRREIADGTNYTEAHASDVVGADISTPAV